MTITIRNFSWDDVLDLVGVINASMVANGRESEKTTEAELRYTLEHMFEAERDCFVAETSPGGALVGIATIMLLAEPGEGLGVCEVVPEYRDQGIGTRLLRTTDEVLLSRLADAVSPDIAIVSNRIVKGDPPSVHALLQAEGYTVVEKRYHLRMELSVALPPVTLPPGIELRPFDREQHARAVYEADQEVHLEHEWQQAQIPFDDWVRTRIAPPIFDPDLWAVAWDSDQVAGVATAYDGDPRKPGLGYISWLGVRAQWRNRGLGRALMTHLFTRLKARGTRVVESHTGVMANPHKTPERAQRLGMAIVGVQHDYQKVLRAAQT